jgi:hypothetical protein
MAVIGGNSLVASIMNSSMKRPLNLKREKEYAAILLIKITRRVFPTAIMILLYNLDMMGLFRLRKKA